jgi:hypothetical protein
MLLQLRYTIYYGDNMRRRRQRMRVETNCSHRHMMRTSQDSVLSLQTCHSAGGNPSIPIYGDSVAVPVGALALFLRKNPLQYKHVSIGNMQVRNELDHHSR